MLDRYTETLCTAQKKTSLESSLLQDIPILNRQDSSQLEDWLMDIETASELTGENRTKIGTDKIERISENLNLQSIDCTKELGGN